MALDARLREGQLDPNRQQRLAERFHWHRIAHTRDDALELLEDVILLHYERPSSTRPPVSEMTDSMGCFVVLSVENV